MNTIFYYNNEGKSFKSRYDATPDCFLYYNDKEYLQYDWTKEPTKSIQQLYKERAEWIRNNYEYIVLCYSGGIDSTNILETFHYNKIPFDEVVIMGAFSQDRWNMDNYNGEIYYNAFPTLNYLHIDLNTELSIIDYTRYLDKPKELSLIQTYGDEWYKNGGSYYSVHHLFWADLPKFINHGTSKKTAIVYGYDKPNFQYNVRPFFNLNDVWIRGSGNFQSWENYERINFYTDYMTMELMAKQYHLIWNFYKEFILTKQSMTHSTFMRNYTQIIHSLIYKLDHPLYHVGTKPTNNVLSDKDSYLLRTTKNSEIYQLFSSMVKKITSTKYDNKKCFYTRSYYLS